MLWYLRERNTWRKKPTITLWIPQHLACGRFSTMGKSCGPQEIRVLGFWSDYNLWGRELHGDGEHKIWVAQEKPGCTQSETHGGRPEIPCLQKGEEIHVNIRKSCSPEILEFQPRWSGETLLYFLLHFWKGFSLWMGAKLWKEGHAIELYPKQSCPNKEEN